MAVISNNINIEKFSSTNEFSNESWEDVLDLPVHMQYNFLNLVEKSNINQLKHLYLKFYSGKKDIARANIYMNQTDFSTLDTELPKQIRDRIKKLYPDFMTFKVVESGHFTMPGNGLFIKNGGPLSEILPSMVTVMNEYSLEQKADIQLIRDVAHEDYNEYLEILKPLGYYPALGFPATVLPVLWDSMEEYFNALKNETRYKMKKSLRLLKEKYDIETLFTKDYQEYIQIMSRLWVNVYNNAKEYCREFLDEEYFKETLKSVPENTEVLLFFYHNELIAFMLNVYDKDHYDAYHWGVDYNFKYQSEANLFRTANLLCLEKAIERKTKVFELGITNYYPKLLMGAYADPLFYFIKHNRKPVFSQTLANLLTKNIHQPDNHSHRAFKSALFPVPDIQLLEKQSKKDQHNKKESDIYYKIEGYQKINSTRLTGLYHLYPEFKTAQKSSVFSGPENKKIVLLGTNSYLGAASHPDVIKAAKEAIDRYGTGCSGSPVLNGTLDIHNQLEKELSEFLGREAVILCSTGYQTNLAGITSLCECGDAVVLDERSHRSLFDAVRMSGASYYTYRHNDMASLEKVLSKLPGQKVLVVTDSVFSMEGTLPDLKSICRLSKYYGARLYVDEAHGIGVLGENGRGACELFGIEKDVDLIMATFSKSFAAIGGFIAGDYEVIDYIKHKGSPHIFSASLPASVIATVLAVLKLIRERPEMRLDILNKAKFMAESLSAMGYRSIFHGTQIVPVVFGNEVLTLAAAKKFMEDGVYVNPVLQPAVPESASGFRTSYIANHEWDDLKQALSVFDRYKEILNS